MMERYTPQAQEVLGSTVGVAETLSHGCVETEHLLIGLLQEGTGVAAKVLEENGVEGDRIVELVSQLIAPNPMIQTADRTAYTPRARRIVENSYKEAVRFKVTQIGTEHILIVMLREGDCVASRLLNTIGVDIQRLYIDLLIAVDEDTPTAKDDPQGARAGKRGNATPTLDNYSRNLTRLATAGKLDPVIGREQEIQHVIQILSRRTKDNPCPVGEPGVDKTAMVEGLAQMITSGDVPEIIADKRVVALDLSDMVAGSKYRGEFKEHIKKVVSEVVESGDVLLFIDEIHTIIGAGEAESVLDVSNILKPSLAGGEIQLIGATTINEYRKYVERDPTLGRRFQPVTVDEPTKDESIAILKGLRNRYEEHHRVEITDHVLEAAVKLSNHYIDNRFLPDKTIDLVDGAAFGVRLQNYTKPAKIKNYGAGIDGLEEAEEEAIKREAYERAREIKKKQEKIQEEIAQAMEGWQKDKESKKLIVSDNEIADVVPDWARIPVRKLAEEGSERLRNLEGILHQRVAGQEEAVTTISKTIRRGRVGLRDLERPTGFFLFLGPTDVGKTELSKALSETMSGTEDALIRMDMSGYMEKYNVPKMIGSPPGYMGYGEGDRLSGKVRRNPYCVILFDEIEKAHPDVFNILLQVLDGGHITDAQGRKIDFKGTIIIMTSNTGAGNVISPKRLEFGMASDVKAGYNLIKGRVMDEVKHLFKPEFLNRTDEIIVFHQLTREHIKGVTDVMLGTIGKHCKEQLGIGLEVADNARRHLIDEGHDGKYRAGPLRHTIQNLVEDRMAERTLDSRIKAGSLVEVGFDGERLTSSVKARTARPKAAAKPANKPAAEPTSTGEGSKDKSKAARSKSRTGRASDKKKETPTPET